MRRTLRWVSSRAKRAGARAAGACFLPFLFAAASAQAQTIAITGGRVFPVSGPPIDNATVLIRDGKIAQVGTNVAIPTGARRIDAAGKWVTPGLIDAQTQLGLFDAGFGAGPTDVAARGRNDALTPSFRVWEGVNPRSVYVAPARQAGVTSVIVAPQTNSVVGGQTAMIDLVDGDLTDMVVQGPVAMFANFDFPPTDRVAARGELFARIRELLEDTKVYMRRRPEFERNQSRELLASRLDLEAMSPVVEGRLPLIVQASRASDIEMALQIAREYSLKLVIAGGAEAWMVAPKLAAAKVPVLVGAMNNIPVSFNTLGMRQENAGRLRAAGVAVAMIGNAGGGDEEAFNVRNIRQEAGNAVAYGMSWNDALRAVTLAPAELFGVADRLGSLQVGREANV
ncbi:MAG TPA: amidohydrolase family protein, partial [Gemmatimonadaceae bacterium]